MASLVADYSSTSSDEDLDSDNVAEESCKANFKKLPRPDFRTSGAPPLKNSVFSNPFVEAENAKKAILEKHVKMTPTSEEVTMINGKKICWNFRKGHCRFGHNCKYAHDSDLLQSKELVEGDSSTIEHDSQIQSHIALSTESQDTEVVSSSVTIKKKKRPGLSQNLTPGKKVMKMYKKQKVKDTSGNR